MPADYPLEQIRAGFPALRDRPGAPAPAYLDGPGGTQVPQSVIDAVADHLAHRNANTGGAFATSSATDRALGDAREAMADFVGAASAREIVFGANMTSLTFAVSRALAREWAPGDEVIVTELDHQANIAPWVRAAEDHGLVVRTVPLDPDSLTLDLDRLDDLLSPRTRLVAVGAASNAVGTITDVNRVAARAREAGALTYVDAVHLAPHRRLDVAALECDFLVCSAYKFFGPHVGVLWARSALLEQFRPYKVPPAPDEAPDRWESGTQNHEGIVGSAAAVDWIARLGGWDGHGSRRTALDRAWEVIAAHESRLFETLRDALHGVRGVRLHGPAPGAARTPTAALTVQGRDPESVAAGLAASGVYVWSGHFYAPNVIHRMGLEPAGGVVRAGLAAYTSGHDVARLIESLTRLARS